MATVKDRNEFEALAEFFRRLRKTLELQGKDFKEHVLNDSALKKKFSRLKKLGVTVKEFKQKKQNEEKVKSEGIHTEEVLLSTRKHRKRRYSEIKHNQLNNNDANPRKKFKLKQYRNNIGFSPSFNTFNRDNNNKNNNIETKETNDNKENTKVTRQSVSSMNICTPLTQNNHREKGILSSNRSLRNRMHSKTQQNVNVNINKTNTDAEPEANTDTDTNIINESSNGNNNGLDGDKDIEMKNNNNNNDEYVPPKRNNTKTKTKTKSKTKTKTKSKAKKKRKTNTKIPQTAKKITKKSVRRKSTKSKTAKKPQIKKRKTKKAGADLTKNFIKMDLKHNSYKRKKRGNKKKKNGPTFDRHGRMRKDSSYYEWKERQRRDRIAKNNLNLENTQHLKREICSDSDQEQDIDLQIANIGESEPENKNEYFRRLSQVKQTDGDGDDDAADAADAELDSLLDEVLQTEYGYDTYRKGQKEAIKKILNKESVLLLLSTGFGKSLCYQIPTILWKNKNIAPLTLVISPLISLMYDQCKNLPSCLNGAVWNSSRSKKKEIYQLRQDVVGGKIDVLFISPEKLDSNYFQRFLRNCIGSERLMFACIDEAHCISEWSHNFRPSYLKLKNTLMDYLDINCILACTATATVITQKSIIQNLDIDPENIVTNLLARDNLHLSVSHIGKNVGKHKKLLLLLQQEKFRNLDSLIVYASTRAEVDEIARKLAITCRRDYGWSIEAYHAGKQYDHRQEIQDKFMKGEVNIIVATIAFGMGLNKKDVRGVIHYSMPKTMEHYVQEIGRAGRDGKVSQCHVFYDLADISLQKSRIYMNGVDLVQVKRILIDLFSAKNVKILRNKHKKNKRKRKNKKNADYDFSDESDDSDESDNGSDEELVLTEFKELNDIVAIHKSTEIEKKYDCKQVVLNTIFTYLDVYKNEYVQQLPSHYNRCKIGIITPDENALMASSEIMKFIINCYNPRNGEYIIHLGKLYNDLRHFEIEDENGDIIEIDHAKWEQVYEISKHLKKLEYERRITLLFDDDCFVVKINKNISNQKELTDLCNNIYEYLSNHEKCELEKINTLGQALKIIANNNEKADEEKDENDNKEEISLHGLVDKYFQCETHDEFLDFVQSYLPCYDHIRTLPVSKNNVMYNEVKQSIIDFIKENRSVKRVRSIAKIFHGFESPLFPRKIWRSNKYWKKHLNFPFMQIIQIAKDVIKEKKNRKNDIQNNDNSNAQS